MKKEFLLAITLAVIIVILLAVLIFVPAKKVVKSGLVVTSIERNDNNFIADIKITGYVNGDGWNPFEAQAGIVKFFDKNNKYLGYSTLSTKGDWMAQPPIYFESEKKIIAKDADLIAKLQFSNENPSGLPEKDKKIDLSVKIEAKTKTMDILVFFNNKSECDKVNFAKRTILETTAPARAALEQLLMGPTKTEKDEGFYTNINPNVKIQSLIIENGVAKVDFSKELEAPGGSCRVSGIRAQITKTLQQFSTVRDVIISINGNSETILQP